jgi:hypothetical protein
MGGPIGTSDQIFSMEPGPVALASPLTTDAVGPSGTSANLGKTTGWLSLSACPSLDDFTPQDGSDMIDNANTADLGDSYDEYLNSGEFSDLPDDPGFALADQDDYGDEWDFGAIIFGTGETPETPSTGGGVIAIGSGSLIDLSSDAGYGKIDLE